MFHEKACDDITARGYRALARPSFKQRDSARGSIPNHRSALTGLCLVKYSHQGPQRGRSEDTLIGPSHNIGFGQIELGQRHP